MTDVNRIRSRWSGIAARPPGIVPLPLRLGLVAAVVVALGGSFAPDGRPGSNAVRAAEAAVPDDDGDFARKADIMHGPRWQQAVAELGGWLSTQTVYSPSQVRLIKVRFNEMVAAMSSYELEYLLGSITQKLDLLTTPEARDAKAWLGEYLSAMSDARRAQALRDVPNLLDMNAAQLWQEIQRIDAKRTTLQARQQAVEQRQGALADRATANRQASARAADAAAQRLRSAPAHSPYRQTGGSPPFSDVPPRRAAIAVGPMGAFIQF